MIYQTWNKTPLVPSLFCTVNVKRWEDFCNPRFGLILSCQLELMKDSGSIKAQLLQELIRATGTVRAIAVGSEGGFALLFRFNEAERTLVNSRGDVRLFASLDTAGSFFRQVGVSAFEVDMTSYQPGRLRGPRPDRAEALKGTRTRLRQQPLEFQNAG
jgi:hypothetical protein